MVGRVGASFGPGMPELLGASFGPPAWVVVVGWPEGDGPMVELAMRLLPGASLSSQPPDEPRGIRGAPRGTGPVVRCGGPAGPVGIEEKWDRYSKLRFRASPGASGGRRRCAASMPHFEPEKSRASKGTTDLEKVHYLEFLEL